MIRVSIIFELLRGHPHIMFWLIALTQAALWWLMPALFYAAPPGDLPLVLAIGHEFQLGSYLGPPLAFWLAEIAYDIAGMTGVYLLSQICVLVTYWAVFELGCATVGIVHAVIAVMLMVGVVAFSLPTPEFGPQVLAMALTALILLHFWKAVGQTKRLYWAAVGVEAGLLLLISYSGVVLCVIVFGFPHLIWLDAQGSLVAPVLDRLGNGLTTAHLFDRVGLPARVLVAHAGLIILVALAAGWGIKAPQRVPVFVRSPVHPFARKLIYTFAIAPLVIAMLLALILGEPDPVGGIAPLIVLSALAVVVFAGDTISINRQHAVGIVWGAMLVVPPIIVAIAVVVLPPITGVEFAVTEPASAIGRYFSDIFQRRTGKVLEIAAGEPRLAALVALKSRPRASLYFDATPERSPWIDAQ